MLAVYFLMLFLIKENFWKQLKIMGQVLLESLSGKQILMFGLTMFLCTVAFFVIGGTKGTIISQHLITSILTQNT